jgi:hypothetical protein
MFITRFLHIRPLSWVFGLLAVILPAILVTGCYNTTTSDGGRACGLMVLGCIMTCAFFAMLLSFIAVTLGIIGYRRTPTPRSKLHLLEVGILGLPLAIGGSLLLYVALH